MNCIQAQMLLAAYREVKNDDVDTAELDEHLEQCSSCREVLARDSLIGEQLRALPPLEPAPAMHAKLLRALANEHAQFIQRSASAPPPPAFLRPYLREQPSSSSRLDAFSAFSSADTGPLPIIRVVPKKRRSHFGQFAVVGLVAVFCVALLMGGITSLLLIAQGNVPGKEGAVTVIHPADVASTAYRTSTDYQHVVSAVADSTSIYYTAYGDGTNAGWVLMQLERTTLLSTPLLPAPRSEPLIVLGSKNGWLIWLQFDAAKTSNQQNVSRRPLHGSLQNWSLHALSLTSSWEPWDIEVAHDPITLTSGTFDQGAVPDWIHSPVQDIWFTQNTLLIAMLDNDGISHLVRYPLTAQHIGTATTIATASPAHIFTSPTANSDGMETYWADEWQTGDGNLHSNIWMQQVLQVTSAHGRQITHTVTVTHLFLEDGLSFRPLVVNDTLFWLSTLTGATTTSTPTSKSTPMVTPNTNGSSIPTTAWNNPALDTHVRGSLLMLPLAGAPTPVMQVNTDGSAYALQAGANFILWQADNGYGMYDVTSHSYITVDSNADNAQFLAVNGDTAVWTPMSAANATPTNTTGPEATLMAFNWPRK